MRSAPLFSAPERALVVTPGPDGASLPSLVEAQGERLHRLLLAHGGILFRGFDLPDSAAFNLAAAQLGGQAYHYVGGNSPRTKVDRDVYTSTEYPASETISLHNEMSYLPHWPRRLFFFSQVPAASGGQTSLACSRAVLRAMPEEIVARLRAKRINYIRHFQPGLKVGKSWQATFQTEDRDELEQILRAQQSRAVWGADGSLRVETRCEAFATHPETGEEVWFNQAEQWHPSALNPKLRALFEARGLLAHGCEFGDGEPMEDAMLGQIRAVVNAHKLLFDWQKNDLLMIDNLLLMHGREAFSGSRSTLAYLSAT